MEVCYAATRGGTRNFSGEHSSFVVNMLIDFVVARTGKVGVEFSGQQFP